MEKLYEGLADIFEMDPSEVGPDTSLEEVTWDSLAMVSTIALFDELFNQSVNVEKLKNCQTVGDIEKLVEA